MNIISLGAGVQSSTMALMAAHGEITPMPDAAIFADTQAEPKAVYEWLDWLEKQLPFPVYRVTKGNLMRDQLRMSVSSDGTKYLRNLIPAFTLNADGTKSMLLRKCTADYKLVPIRRKVRELMILAGEKFVTQWIGISTDESGRMRDSAVKYIINTYPLITLGLSRNDCLGWLRRHNYSEPTKSACIVCPYHNDNQWRSLTKDEIDQAVEFERTWGELAKGDKRKTQIRGDIRLHSSLLPLDQVDFSTDEDRGQLNMFNNECEGLCGV